ncbi:hypothetical protein C8R47DRAFT_213385 [Mycena vitilis]|nr:hypothetical protein C8R47DRAFT_213385 [Mycena vitilis]
MDEDPPYISLNCRSTQFDSHRTGFTYSHQHLSRCGGSNSPSSWVPLQPKGMAQTWSGESIPGAPNLRCGHSLRSNRQRPFRSRVRSRTRFSKFPLSLNVQPDGVYSSHSVKRWKKKPTKLQANSKDLTENPRGNVDIPATSRWPWRRPCHLPERSGNPKEYAGYLVRLSASLPAAVGLDISRNLRYLCCTGVLTATQFPPVAWT